MKKLSLILTLLFFGVVTAQENFEISTIRIGPYKIFMKATEAEKIAGEKLKQFDDYKKKNIINFSGETLEIELQDYYFGEKEKNASSILSLSTKSPKFKTKSGMGVGNTKDDLIEAYKNYPNFSVSQGWDDKGEKLSKSISYFILSDINAGTELSFKLENNVVAEINIYINEGC